MRTGGEHATADQERLALYLLGAMNDAERESFEAHLAACWDCLNEAAELGPSISGLVGLADDDWSPPSTAAVGPAPLPRSAPDAPDAEPDGARDPGTGAAGRERTAARSGPGGVRPGAGSASGARPATKRSVSRRRRLAIWVGTAVAAVALALAGGLAAIENFAGDDRVLTASGEAAGPGVSLSVVITTGEEGGSTIRITVTGLRQGLRYRMFAVTRDGNTHVVRDWTATAGPQEVAGETTLPLDELSFVTVGLPDGSAVVTAPIRQDPAQPR